MPGLLDLFNSTISPNSEAVLATAVATAFLTRTPTSIDSVILDASVTETHTLDNEVTDHPVETGFAVTDHVRAKPDLLSIEGLVSNTPLSHVQRTRVIQALGITFESNTDANAIVGQKGYAEQAYAALREMRDKGTLVTVVTSLRTYRNMVMVSLVVPRSKDVGDALRFTCQFKRIRIVSNKLTAAKKQSNAGKKVSGGKQPPKKTDAATQKKSIAYELKEGVQGVIKKLGGGAP